MTDHHFTLYELYADEAAVEAHRSAPHFKVWREAVAEHVVPGSQATTLARRPPLRPELHRQRLQSSEGARMRQPRCNLLIRPGEIEPFDRGNGVVTLPYVGRWNSENNRITTGQTVFRPAPDFPCTATTGGVGPDPRRRCDRRDRR